MKVIIIGCTHAGLVAAKEILEIHPDTQVTIYERTNGFSFMSDGVFLYLNHSLQQLDDTFVSSPAQLVNLGVKVCDNHNVLAVDPQKKTITAADMTNETIIQDDYDRLIVATGANVRLPAINGIDNPRVLLCKNYQQVQRMLDLAESNSNQRIAIVGAGYVGVGLAEGFATNGHQVQLFQSHQQILNNYFNQETAARITALLEDHGVKVQLQTQITNIFEKADHSLQLKTANRTFSADMIVICTGFIPNTRLLKNQLKTDNRGALLLNNYLQTSDPNIYAAGDCAAVRFNPTDSDAYIPLASNAIRQGKIAAHNIFKNYYPYTGTQATSALKILGHYWATSGLTIENARHYNLNAFEVTLTTDLLPEYLSNEAKLNISLIYNRDNRRIIGAQLDSNKNLMPAINTISLAIQNHNTIDDLAFVDMFFQPEFNQPFNYLNQVAQAAIRQERKAGFEQPHFTYDF
ncbi:MAG: FAD-dependent oxidoreductase [Liquorilactobacillus nagelii]|jgi:NADPH-dependent 2,4-dienoyl-CoA reductase/sulfur reductase-like enzyme|uniref:NAD(P)/FAD-dependent oxidoreductase n=1 Tax=Liquorilactobacillus nagelii TaxID=82688 RepID=UPI00242FE231|nr:FAD-dependent oxidoreductase [Liquorilactobacillus nagelii]MCI1921396.1 FAD-dependent oxidoreductase [Liquorilactobacillus nagelii]MCI1978028.1 FAD-dependent oxidoreductase [Liquorilactobacillus nagelii]